MENNKHGKFNPNNLDGRPKKNRFKLSDGSNLFRILPPFGTLAKLGIIAKYWAVYWVKDSRGKPKPVVSILQTDKDKRVITPDPMFDAVERLKKDLEALKAKKAPDAIIEAMQKTVDGLRIDKGYYLNVMSTTGEIGVLKLRYTAFQDLKRVLKKLEKDRVDPINVGTGVFLDFQKLKDDQNKTVYKVEVHEKTYQDQTTKRFMKEMVEAPIDESTLQRMESEAFELATLYNIFSPEEQALAATLDPSVVDRLFARAEDVTPDDGTEEEDLAAPAVQNYQAKAGTTGTNSVAAAQPEAAPAPVAASLPLSASLPPATTVAPAQAAPAIGNPKDLQDMVGKFLRGQLGSQ